MSSTERCFELAVINPQYIYGDLFNLEIKHSNIRSIIMFDFFEGQLWEPNRWVSINFINFIYCMQKLLFRLHLGTSQRMIADLLIGRTRRLSSIPRGL